MISKNKKLTNYKNFILIIITIILGLVVFKSIFDDSSCYRCIGTVLSVLAFFTIWGFGEMLYINPIIYNALNLLLVPYTISFYSTSIFKYTLFGLAGLAAFILLIFIIKQLIIWDPSKQLEKSKKKKTYVLELDQENNKNGKA